ncbi:hypothetical protein A3A93_04980 [Candidatus Roizmanbacteria bacterium RIFCSPLOWO2_01_FULL_38_12]|uniref:LysM domain-containing protein n=1 Tax=Candidatus Roizmanbacteria bacterium RIFCSPLOWO2_01_FULL_38_12 TaxID=1802061 RepID=A0A1F7J0P3_9BACT|nr:MAG: hypothetical protein A2861_03430 [Candidatus Roizmanbacteria bacterium RIFCSPHIGHO2_01_FULL_38_15]OGK36206.1 MAG: hypothetical protein A3F59_04540 [Candidatus Roizmanbacteria bacterium RIFCSPHIGHO2_12_FULL_38_13]OGK49187.1 MAG: hypothetical protein A3A93_04980 [Candidatus Roizmanbacteria bacterium RIFCSPLOWO2_01_FULL_38_12]
MEHTESIQHLRGRIAHLLKNELSYVVIGFFVVVSISLFSVIWIYDNRSLPKGLLFGSLNQSDKSQPSADADAVATLIDKQNLDYISPLPTKTKQNVQMREEEQGQISAISSGQVTNSEDIYIIQPGESLADVARKVYGDPNAWVRIAQANNISNPDHIEVGTKLVIPR